MTGDTTVLWFRRDLRLHDNPALTAAVEDAAAVAPLFVMDDAILGADPAPNRLWFMLGTLRSLQDELERRGSRLHIRSGRPEEAVATFAREVGASRVHVSRDFSPYGRTRDLKVHEALARSNVPLRRHPGVLVHDPEAIVGRDGSPYTVYSPFRRAWDRLERRAVLPGPDRIPPWPAVAPGELPARPHPTADPDLLPEPGEPAARERLARWVAGAVDGYATSRDELGAKGGTSRLSQDLRFGLLSPLEVATAASGPGEGRRRFVAELAWRDFYAHGLWHRPALLREAFRPEMEAAFGPGDEAHVDAWREGRTGYPLVDAAMRQLAAAGWMHNRGRMVVASFLTKHLLVDRRVGESHFWRHLVDGDPASNNGGWQWAASTGTDPQPYFRIFNPILQARRFDPDGDYVRRWVPELAAVPAPWIHTPWLMPPDVAATSGCQIGVDYPPPIVDHSFARERALAALSAAGTPGRA